MASMVFLGFSVVIFLVSYSVMFLLAPSIFNEVFIVIEGFMTDRGNMSPEWQAMYDTHKEYIGFFTPLILLLGVFIMIIKTALAVAARGAD